LWAVKEPLSVHHGQRTNFTFDAGYSLFDATQFGIRLSVNQQPKSNGKDILRLAADIWL
jgi:hypothetical protein